MPAIGGLRFRLLTSRLMPDDPDARRRAGAAVEVLELLDRHLDARDFVLDGRYSIADIALYGYTHVAPEAGLGLDPYPALRA
jgi:glutathione S-transferase